MNLCKEYLKLKFEKWEMKKWRLDADNTENFI
jgi:hypothetical protein